MVEAREEEGKEGHLGREHGRPDYRALLMGAMNARARQVLCFLLVSALFQACHGRSTTRSSTDGAERPPRRSTALCPGADTLRYSNLRADDETVT